MGKPCCTWKSVRLMACLASTWISCVEIVSCYKSPAFCHVLALAQQAVMEVQSLVVALSTFTCLRRSWSETEAEMERQSRDLSFLHGC